LGKKKKKILCPNGEPLRRGKKKGGNLERGEKRRYQKDKRKKGQKEESRLSGKEKFSKKNISLAFHWSNCPGIIHFAFLLFHWLIGK
jgi:hypothetical protein